MFKEFGYYSTIDHESKEVEFNSPISFAESLKENIECIDSRYRQRLPDNYLQIQTNLIKKEVTEGRERLTVFHGGPMRWQKYGIEDGWLTPCEFAQKDGEKTTELMFHLLSINCQAGENFEDAQVEISFAIDDDLKLQTADPTYAHLRTAIIANPAAQKKVIIRPCFNGALAFPKIKSSFEVGPEGINEQKIWNGLQMIAQQYKLNLGSETTIKEQIRMLFDRQTFKKESEISPDCFKSETKQFFTDNGVIYQVEIADPNCMWQIYKIYSAQPLEQMDLANDFVPIRIDSGCDMSMNYFDDGCDCHEQLLLALKQIQEQEKGLVIHLPTQDGRGYGANTKCLTEGLKWGKDVKTKKDLEQGRMSTTKAAEAVFGNKYDIRSYRHVALALANLGVKKVRLMTDNAKKFWAATRVFGSENVARNNTDTVMNMIREGKDPMSIAQMLTKLAHDAKYTGLNDEVIDSFLRYAGIVFSDNDTRDEKLNLINVEFSEV